MLESLVASLLNRFLGSYVENFDPKQLNIGIWSGDVKLKNLKLKKESLDRLKLPLDVKFGYLGQLTLQIPWSNLKSKPVKVFIEDVYVLASPIIVTEYDEAEEAARELALKKRKLEDLEIMDKSKPDPGSSEEDAKNMTFTENLVTKIVDNVQVTIKNIHVRYEDESVFSEDPYSVGLTLSELSAVSTDESWLPKFISGGSGLTNKLLTLDSFEVYWNTELDTIYSDDTDAMLAKFKELILQNSQGGPETQYLLKPVSGTGHLTVNKRGPTEDHPHIKTELFFDEFGVDLDSEQYRDILWTASKFHWYMKTQQFRKFRPKKTVQEAPLEWFRYAAKSVLSEVHEKNYKWTWDHFRTRRDQRLAYVALWRTKLLSNTPLPVEKQKELDDLEVVLTFDDLRFYRSLARSQNKKELLEKRNNEPVAGQVAAQQKQSGWLSSWWSGNNDATGSAAAAPDDELQMTEEQRKELYDAIEYDERKSLVEAVDIPADRVKMEVTTVLKRGALAIRKSKGDKNLAEVIFEGCKTQFFQRPTSFLASFQLQEFKVEDGTDSTLYKHIVSVEQLHSGIHLDLDLDGDDDAEKEVEPFFQVAFENNPLDGSADSALSSKLRSMTIFHNPKFIEDVAKFFRPPKIHLDTVGAIMNAAESTLEGFTAQTRIGLQYALEEHKTLNCKLDLQAPLIIVPLDPSDWSSPVAILDAGHISVASNLADPKIVEKFKNSSSSSIAKDWDGLNSLMYDKFDLHLQDAQILVGDNIKSTIEQLHSEREKPALILDNLSIKFALEVSILPTAYNLARFKIGANIDRFRASLNDYQYKVLMQLIDKAIPDFDFDDAQEPDVAFPTLKQSTDVELDEIPYGDSDSASVASKTSVAAKDAARDSSAKEKQHLFEFRFNVDTIQLSLSRCVDTSSLQSEPLVELIGSHLQLDFYRTALDLGVDLVLSDISIEDHIVSSSDPEFAQLVSTNVAGVGADSPQKNADLLQLSYKRTQRIVEFNDKEIEVFDQDVDVDFASIKFVVTRKSVLTLLNFILNTFTDPNPPETPADELRHNADDEASAPQKMNVNVNLDSIVLVLNDDGIKLATLRLSQADVNVFMVPEKMRVFTRLGGLTLHDDLNESVPADFFMRQLISITGDELAEMTYETFDRANNANNYNSQFKFNAGSVKINYVEAPFTQIFGFLSKFQQMKGIYDSARQAALNQASNIEDANAIRFDVLVQTPIVTLPRLVDAEHQQYDFVTVNLGELYLNNEFVEKSFGTVNLLKAGIRSTKIVSEFVFTDCQQRSEMISGLDVGFEVEYLDKYHPDHPSMLVKGSMDGSELLLTEHQTAHLFETMQSVSRVFSSELADSESLSELENDAAAANRVLASNSPVPVSAPVEEPAADSDVPRDHVKVDFSFDAPRLSLTLFNDTENVEDFSAKSLTRLALNDTGATFTMKQDGNYKAELHVKSFVVEDTRAGTDSKFTEIIPETEHESSQFMASFYSEGAESSRYTYAMLSVDSPKTILALDYLFALKRFSDVAFKTDEHAVVAEGPARPQERRASVFAASQVPQHEHDGVERQAEGTFGFTLNIVNSSVILLADPSAADSEAIAVKVEQMLITSQNIVSLSASKVGMFLCRMDDFEGNRLRIIDDFSASLTVDSRGSDATTFLTNVEASVDPLLMRLSLRDIRLAMAIFNKAAALYSASAQAMSGAGADTADDTFVFTREFKKKLSQYAPTITSNVSSVSKVSTRGAADASPVVVKGEKLLAEMQGFRLVFIGDVHELPVLDMNVGAFTVEARNWSTDLESHTSVESFVNIFNYSTSTWEPLIEPWPVSFNVSRSSGSNACTVVEVNSDRLAEATVTSRSIALMSQIFSLLSEEEELKSRDENTPYRIHNQTGYDVKVWIDDGARDARASETVVKNGDSLPWFFEDWRAVRESLSADTESGLLGVELVDSPYTAVSRISVKGEGEALFVLQPPVGGVHNRLACDVQLNADKVKDVVLRSTVTVENQTVIPIRLRFDGEAGGGADGKPVGDVEIQPGDRRAVPIGAAYGHSFSVKPLIQAQYGWSQSSVRWKDLVDGSASLMCLPEDTDNSAEFFFEVGARYDRDEPLTRIYPHMAVVVSSPIEIENLLPYDISYRIYDKARKKDWKNFLKAGATSPVHVVRLQNLLLLSLQPVDSGFGKSEFAIINAPKRSDFSVDKRIFLKGDRGQKLFLNIHYAKLHSSGSGVKISVYTPYLVLNRTGEALSLSDNYNVMQSSAHQTVTEDDAGHEVIRTSKPDMFSFEKPDRSNRALLTVADSGPSKPVGLDAVGQAVDIVMPVPAKQTEMNVGMHIAEGEGIYKLTKVVTFAPRYVLRNCFGEAIQVREVGSSHDFVVEQGAAVPLYHMRRIQNKQLMVKFFGAESQWSSPFNVSDIGQIHVKILKQGVGHVLLKVSIILENASLFISVFDAKSQWPFSIRNFSDEEILFYQSDPNMDENGGQIMPNRPPFKPIYYRLPPKSVMPYAWDFPAGYLKELVIRSHGRERHIQLAEIGNLRPMRLPATETRAAAIVELNVVADGPTQSLVITNYDASTSLYRIKSQRNSELSLTQDHFESVETDENYYSKVVVKLEGLGISLINHHLQELCYLTFRGVEIRYNESDVYQTVSAKLKWIQIDNQVFGSLFPMVLYPSVVPQSQKEVNNHPTFSGSVSRVKDDAHGVEFIKYATVLLQEISVEIDEDFLLAVLDFAQIPGASWNRQLVDRLWDDTLEIPEPRLIDSAEDVYFEALHLQPMQMNLSFVRTDRLSADDKQSSNNPVMFFLNVLTMAIGNINDAPVRLNALFIENVKVPIPILIQMVQSHYGQAFLYQIHKILGSADVLGNPVGLFNNISSGFMDIFYEPYQGLIMNDRPQELGIGLAKGGLSFIKKSVFGFSDSFAKFTGSVAKGLTAATLDKEFQERRRLKQRRNRPKQAMYRFSDGATSLVDSISSGLVGVAAAPIEGSKQGAGGFLKGLGKGLVGLPTKTAIGFFDLASNVSEGIRTTTTAFDKAGIEKVRLPRYIAFDNVVRPFSEREAQGQYWLKVIDGGAMFNDVYLAHVMLPGDENAIIVSFKYIVMCSIVNLTSRWKIGYGDIRSISLENTGIKIGVKSNSGLRDGPFIPLSDSATRKFLYSKIEVAVREYNKHCQVVL